MYKCNADGTGEAAAATAAAAAAAAAAEKVNMLSRNLITKLITYHMPWFSQSSDIHSPYKVQASRYLMKM